MDRTSRGCSHESKCNHQLLTVLADNLFLLLLFKAMHYMMCIRYISCLLYLPSQFIKLSIYLLCLWVRSVICNKSMYLALDLNPAASGFLSDASVLHQFPHFCYVVHMPAAAYLCEISTHTAAFCPSSLEHFSQPTLLAVCCHEFCKHQAHCSRLMNLHPMTFC